MAARIDSSGKVTTLDAKAAPEEIVSEADVQDPAKLAKLLARLLSTVATLKRAFAPKWIDFEDVAVSTAGAQVALAHGFKGRVRWWIVGWASTGTSAPILRESTSTVTDANTLYLQSYVAGVATVRIEQVG